MKRGTGRHPIPVILLARLGVDVTEQGRGLGAALVKDALQRAAAAGHEIRVRAVLIHAEREAARDFSLHLAEFEPSPTDPLHLYLLMKDLRATIGSRGRPRGEIPLRDTISSSFNFYWRWSGTGR